MFKKYRGLGGVFFRVDALICDGREFFNESIVDESR